MGSSDSGGGSSEEKRARARVASQEEAMESAAMQMKRKEEEAAILAEEERTGQKLFVRSGGKIVRSGSGAAVLQTAGQAFQQSLMQEELLKRTGGDPNQRAIQQLEQRLADTFMPGTLGIMKKLNIERQIKELKAGGTAQFRRTSTGRYVTTNVASRSQFQNLGNTPNIQQISYGGGDEGGGQTSAPAATTTTATATASGAAEGPRPSQIALAASGAARRRLLKTGLV